MPPLLTPEDRRRLLAEVSALAGASVQKLWLPAAPVCVLQLRVPGRTLLVVADARLGMAAIAPERPTAAQSAPRSQATLRSALEGARLAGAALQVALDRRDEAPRLDFETAHGPRSLVAQEALVLVDGARRIVWASSGAGPDRRPGAQFPSWREVAPGPLPPPLPQRDDLVRAALQREEEAGLAARRKELLSRLESRLQKLRRTLAAVDEDLARASRAEIDRARAELLLPIASRIPRGAREARVQDWSRTDKAGVPAEVVIALDPALSAAEHAARWLKKAKRYQAAAARIAQRRAEVEEQRADAESLLARAQAAATAAEIQHLETRLPPLREPRSATAAAGRLPYRTYRTRKGAPILVGRSARDNDALTFRVARGNDVWAHARDVKGAHVVLPGAGETPDSDALVDALLLAAHFSPQRTAAVADVAWTRVKYLRKPRGAAPGSVIITQEKNVRVRLDGERLAELLRTEGG